MTAARVAQGQIATNIPAGSINIASYPNQVAYMSQEENSRKSGMQKHLKNGSNNNKFYAHTSTTSQYASVRPVAQQPAAFSDRNFQMTRERSHAPKIHQGLSVQVNYFVKIPFYFK